MRKIPLGQEARMEVTRVLSQMLADTYVLYVKTQNFHWNVVDPRFYQLHKFFEGQYEELAEALDIIAERIRMMGGKSPGSMHRFLELSTLKESDEELSTYEMLQQLTQDHIFMSDSTRFLIEEVSKFGDEGTADMMINRLRSHEKNAWMLQSHGVSIGVHGN